MIFLNSTLTFLILWLDNQTFKKFNIQDRTAMFKVSLAPIFVKLLLSPFTTPCCPLWTMVGNSDFDPESPEMGKDYTQ